MTYVDWLLLVVFGVPLAYAAGDFWMGVIDGAVDAARLGVARLRRACPGGCRGRSDFAAFDKEENRL